MNKYNFLQAGGFPFETDILDGMQKAYEIFNSLGALAGNFTIISGCLVTGSTVGNGFLHIDGEIYPFIGGTIQTTVVFQTVTQTVEFEDLSTKDIQIKKHVQFGTGVGSMLWADFKRPETTTQLTTLIQNLTTRVTALESQPTAFEVGMIMLWNRPAIDIPAGWVEATEMRGRTPVGLNPSYTQGSDLTNYALDTLGFQGGAREHTLTKPEMPVHKHEQGSESIYNFFGGGNYVGQRNWGSGGSFNVFTKQLTSAEGEDKAHNNMSPYRVVHFIKYTG